MATSTTVNYIEFDLDKALEGYSIGFRTDSAQAPEFIYKFKYNSRPKYEGYYYEGIDTNGTKYYFDDTGLEHDSERQLYIIVSTIDITLGTSASRGDEGSEVTLLDIDNLQPRETLAMAALVGLLHNENDIASLNDTRITQYCNAAFKIAQEMINTAADYRERTQHEESPDQVDIDMGNVTSTTDKLLYNINSSIKAISDKYAKQSPDDITKVEITNDINAKILNEELTARIANDKLNVNVGNFPEVTTVHINNNSIDTVVTNVVTASVNNFPSSYDANVTNWPSSYSANVANWPSSVNTYVQNFPSTYSVEVTNLPGVQPVSVTNFPSTQTVAGSVVVRTGTDPLDVKIVEE